MRESESKTRQRDLRQMIDDGSYRYQVFAKVFNNDDGRAVLDYLRTVYEIGTPDFNTPSEVYWELGRQSVITGINNILTNGDKNND